MGFSVNAPCVNLTCWKQSWSHMSSPPFLPSCQRCSRWCSAHPQYTFSTSILLPWASCGDGISCAPHFLALKTLCWDGTYCDIFYNPECLLGKHHSERWKSNSGYSEANGSSGRNQPPVPDLKQPQSLLQILTRLVYGENKDMDATHICECISMPMSD